MRSLRFYLSQFGKRCGYLECDRKGYLPAYSFEKSNRGLWVSCGKIHRSEVTA